MEEFECLGIEIEVKLNISMHEKSLEECFLPNHIGLCCEVIFARHLTHVEKLMTVSMVKQVTVVQKRKER